MSRSKKQAPGPTVSVMEINDLITRSRDIRAHLESNRRHLAMIDDRLRELEETVEGLHVDDVVIQDEEAED